MTFQKGHKLATGRPKGSLNKLTKANREFLHSILFDEEQFIKDWMELDLNGERMQTGNTKTMIFNVDHIVSYVSRYMSLQPGDIITTGTPPGVGMGMKPQKFLKAGDEMRLSIELLGEQKSKVVAI